MKNSNKPKAIVTDIEGTTTSVAFVYDILFPYFISRIPSLLRMLDQTEVRTCFDQIKAMIHTETNENVEDSDVLTKLEQWVQSDQKETNLKTLQGIIWRDGYFKGELKGHIYQDVPPKLREWSELGIELAIYSSGSIAAQKLLFAHSDFGDLTPLFKENFDTTTGHKRESASYTKIAAAMDMAAIDILFLSDVEEELIAASESGMRCLQLVRPGTTKSMQFDSVESFDQINFN